MKSFSPVYYLSEYKEKINEICKSFKHEDIEKIEELSVKLLASSKDWSNIPTQVRKHLILELIFNTFENLAFLHCGLFQAFLSHFIRKFIEVNSRDIKIYLNEVKRLGLPSYSIKEEDFLMYLATSRKLSLNTGALSEDLFPDYLTDFTETKTMLESEKEIKSLWIKLNELLDSRLQNNTRNWCVLYLNIRTGLLTENFLKNFELEDNLINTLKEVVFSDFGLIKNDPPPKEKVELLIKANLVFENPHLKNRRYYSTELSSELVLKSLNDYDKQKLSLRHFDKLPPNWQVFLLEWIEESKEVSLQEIVSKNRIHSKKVKERILDSIENHLVEENAEFAYGKCSKSGFVS